jgi:hypothetical protein
MLFCLCSCLKSSLKDSPVGRDYAHRHCQPWQAPTVVTWLNVTFQGSAAPVSGCFRSLFYQDVQRKPIDNWVCTGESLLRDEEQQAYLQA